jgi:hypothetical protein
MSAAAAVAKLRGTILREKSREGRPWSELLPGAAVKHAGPGVVRLTALPPPASGARQGLLMTAALRNDLPDRRP